MSPGQNCLLWCSLPMMRTELQILRCKPPAAQDPGLVVWWPADCMRTVQTVHIVDCCNVAMCKAKAAQALHIVARLCTNPS